MLTSRNSARFEDMFAFKHLRSSGNDRLGLVMIVASLVAIALSVVTLLWNQKQNQEAQIRVQGVSLTRMLAGLPYSQLPPAPGQQDLLNTIFQSQNDDNFAYAAIIDTENEVVSVATAPGITVPPMEWPDKPPAWLSDRSLETSSGERILEFYTPLHTDGVTTAYLRLGYRLPGMGVSVEEVPFLATLALIIFLLTPLFYFLVRKEVRPLREASERMTSIIEGDQFTQIDLRMPDELSGFLDRFTAFVDFAKTRIDGLEDEQEKLLTSRNLVNYSKSRVEAVLEALPEAVLILDQSGNIKYANRRISNLLGVSRDEVVNGNPADWCESEELFAVISKYAGQPVASRLTETTRLNVGVKQEKNLAVKAYPLFSQLDPSEVYGSLIVIRDVTKESMSQRQQGEFVAHVAHELKTPLNTLSLCTEALINDSDEDPQSRIDSANVIHDEVQRLAGLIDNLLNITRIEMGEISIDRQQVRLHDFLEDTFKVASRSSKGGELTFELDLSPGLSTVLVDKDLFRIAVNNLLTNAVKYSRPGGVIRMTCEETDQSIRIAIRDDGIGIATDDQERIFDRFYRSEDPEARSRSGHGLGLPLARDIVQLHYGTLTVTSTHDEGSEFVIQIWKEAGMLKQVV